jgi:hypothetical protein
MFDVVVSDPIPPVDAMAVPAGGLFTALTAAGDAAFVSVPPGTAPTGTSALIANLHTGESIPVTMVDGGFDPIRIAAEAGDTLEVTIGLPNGEFVSARSIVPARRRPRVVRTSPIRGRTDVALNSIVRVIFSEPIDRATLDTSTVRLLGSGGAMVAGVVRTMEGSSVGVEFVPGAPLAPGTEYRLVLADRITDLAGAALEVPAPTAFTTLAEPPVAPEPPALGSRLVFTAQPANRTAWLRFDAPPVVVTALTSLGARDQAFNGVVILSLVDPVGEASLLDPVGGYVRLENRGVIAVGGVATFDWVGVAGDGGSGYVLAASASGFESTISAPFDVAPNPGCAGCWDYSVAPIGDRSR